MATVVDAARDTTTTVLCASETMQKGNDHPDTPTPAWDIGFDIVASVVDPDMVVPTFVDMSAFWLDSTPATVRL